MLRLEWLEWLKGLLKGKNKNISETTQKTDFFENDSEGRLDDVAVHDVSLFRLERMTESSFWAKAYKADGNDIVFWIFADRDDAGEPVVRICHEHENQNPYKKVNNE